MMMVVVMVMMMKVVMKVVMKVDYDASHEQRHAYTLYMTTNLFLFSRLPFRREIIHYRASQNLSFSSPRTKFHLPRTGLPPAGGGGGLSWHFTRTGLAASAPWCTGCVTTGSSPGRVNCVQSEHAQTDKLDACG